MRSVDIPRLTLDRRFADIDEYAQEVGWDLDFRQIDAGSPPEGLLTFGLPDPEVGEFRWCGARAGSLDRERAWDFI